jgi:RES domain-containing protein
MLEKLVHANFIMPANQHYIKITISNGVSYEVFKTPNHPGWDGKSEAICKTFAENWCTSARTAILMVPSIPARLETNFLINPAHPDAKGITHDLPEPVWWDQRLYGKP